MPQPKELIGRARLPQGQELTLTRQYGHFHMAVDGVPLMSSAAQHSEQKMATVGCEGFADRPRTRTLVGGLGMGYTLRAALDAVSPTSRVVVAEFVREVIDWNRGALADLAARPLEDPRAELYAGDIVKYLASGPEQFDAILLDTDNGPDDFTAKGNAALYTPKGLARLRSLLRPGGRLVVWSAYQCPPFVGALKRAGFTARALRAKARGTKGGRHTLYVGVRPLTEDAARSAARPGNAQAAKPAVAKQAKPAGAKSTRPTSKRPAKRGPAKPRRPRG
ncbi:MAG: hypothetical protein O2894_12085 [Planctomycetota bacterium]|nr:hypothetical protein [Planctomycetota bacterium]